MKKLFDVPDSYKEHITKFDSSDGFLALGIIVTYFVVMTISGIIVQYISQLQITIIGGVEESMCFLWFWFFYVLK